MPYKKNDEYSLEDWNADMKAAREAAESAADAKYTREVTGLKGELETLKKTNDDLVAVKTSLTGENATLKESAGKAEKTSIAYRELIKAGVKPNRIDKAILHLGDDADFSTPEKATATIGKLKDPELGIPEFFNPAGSGTAGGAGSGDNKGAGQGAAGSNAGAGAGQGAWGGSGGSNTGGGDVDIQTRIAEATKNGDHVTAISLQREAAYAAKTTG
jgi:hypothetical protein